jgi:hypothetical protein
MPRKPLPARLDMELIARLNRVSNTRKISVNDVISLALDGLEGEREVAQTITDRIEFLEKNLAALVELMEIFDKKMEHLFIESGASEKERLKALYLLFKANMNDHDKAEQERFAGLKPRAY